MRIGRMRTLLEVQTGAIVKDSDYGTSKKATWTRKCSIWAEKVSMSGGEQIEALAVVGKQVMKFRTRYREDITTEMRLIHKTEVYDIKSIVPEDSQNMYMVITGVKGLNNG